MEKIENVVLRHLIYDADYTQKVLPYLKEDYFTYTEEKILFDAICNYVLKYNNCPSIEALEINLETKSLHPDTQKAIQQRFADFEANKNNKLDDQWLLDETERFCKEKAIYNAIRDSIDIMDNKDKVRDRGVIPELLSEALGISFDTNIGHDYFEDAENRYNFFSRKEAKYPFDLEFFNLVTKGGVQPKTLNVILAGTNVGKSLMMCHFAASYIAQGFNVLYITLEMSEEAIARRIDANLYDMDIDDIAELPKETYLKKIERVKNKVHGKLIIKEFPTASAHSIHFKNTINDLKLKKNFKPDIVFVDYINICASSRIKMGGNANMYLYIKSIAEELRGLAVELGLPIWTATQTTRSGFKSSDPDLTDTSESFGLPATADFMVSVTTNDELEELNQFLVKQLKSRYGDKNKNKRFLVGVQRARMKLFDTEQGYIADSGQEEGSNNKRNNDDDLVEVRSDKQSKFRKLRVE